MIKLQIVASGYSRAYRLVCFEVISFNLFMSTGNGAHVSVGLEIFRFEMSFGLGVWGKKDASVAPV